MAARMSKAGSQPRLSIRPRSIGTIMNWPNEPAAAVMPIAPERCASGTARTMTQNTTL